MSAAPRDTAMRRLRRAALRQDGASRTDGQLLACFIDQQDEAAFEVLVRRHGPMVFGVCRRVVGNHHDAEDAFQATFLVLARKASSVRPRERVANWLYGVAVRTAMKAKVLTARRQGREKQAAELPEPQAAEPEPWRDLRPVLDQELNRLPESYRLPMLLCDLGSKTIREAAQQLGWPQGTLATRLARGRKLLAKRLTCRGVALSAGSLAAVVAQNAVAADAPAALRNAAVRVGTMMATGLAAAQGPVAVLTEEVLKTMFLTKLRTVASVVLAVAAVIASVAGPLGYRAAARQNESTKGNAAVPRNDAAKTDMEKLQGLWQVVSMETDGRKLGGDSLSKLDPVERRVLIAGDTWTSWDAGGREAKTTFTIDVTKSPKWIDLQGSAGGPLVLSIYEFEGDLVKIAVGGGAERERPTDFTPRKGSPIPVMVFKRVRKADPGMPGKGQPEPRGDKAKTDKEKLQGLWQMESMEGNGQKITRDDLANVDPEQRRVLIAGDAWITRNGQGREEKTAFQVDVTKMPKTIDIQGLYGARCQLGVYELKGDELRVCLCGVEKQVRPTDFTTGTGSPMILIVYKRVAKPEAAKPDKSKAEAPAKPSARTDLERLQGVWSVVSTEMGGRPAAPEKVVFMVDGKRACWQSRDSEIQGGLYLDASGNPKTYDLATTTSTVEGIYALDGDTLRLCYNLGAESKRPSGFVTQKGSQRVLVVLKRIHGPEAFPYRLADGTRAFPPLIERKTARPAPPPQVAPVPEPPGKGYTPER